MRMISYILPVVLIHPRNHYKLSTARLALDITLINSILKSVAP